jgi:hypothetical protein
VGIQVLQDLFFSPHGKGVFMQLARPKFSFPISSAIYDQDKNSLTGTGASANGSHFDFSCPEFPFKNGPYHFSCTLVGPTGTSAIIFDGVLTLQTN